MTIEDARNLIAEAEGQIEDVMHNLVCEIGIVPKSIDATMGMENITSVTDTEPVEAFVCRVSIQGMEL